MCEEVHSVITHFIHTLALLNRYLLKFELFRLPVIYFFGYPLITQYLVHADGTHIVDFGLLGIWLGVVPFGT